MNAILKGAADAPGGGRRRQSEGEEGDRKAPAQIRRVADAAMQRVERQRHQGERDAADGEARDAKAGAHGPGAEDRRRFA